MAFRTGDPDGFRRLAEEWRDAIGREATDGGADFHNLYVREVMHL